MSVSASNPDGSAYSNIGANASLPRGRVDTNWQYFTNFTHTVGRHTWKFGYEFRRTTVSQIFDSYFRGRLDFSDTDTATALGNFLAGTPTGGFQYSGDSNRNTFVQCHEPLATSRTWISWGNI